MPVSRAAAQHQPAHADIGPAGLRIDDVVDRGRDIGPAVGAVLEMHRQRGEVGVVAGQHDLLHRRLGAGDLDDLRLVAQPPQHFGSSSSGATPKARAMPRAAADDVADQLLPLRPDRAEQHRFADCRRGSPRRRRDRSARRAVSSSSAGRPSTKRRSRKRSKSASVDDAAASVFSTMPISAMPAGCHRRGIIAKPAAIKR